MEHSSALNMNGCTCSEGLNRRLGSGLMIRILLGLKQLCNAVKKALSLRH